MWAGIQCFKPANNVVVFLDGCTLLMGNSHMGRSVCAHNFSDHTHIFLDLQTAKSQNILVIMFIMLLFSKGVSTLCSLY